MKTQRLGTMIDCSRNAVMSIAALKKWIDITSSLGYNTVMLYTEDTYEVDDNPYFGYLRGRYSKAELKEIDAYAAGKGMELIPCIQTLAHLNAIKRWPCYSSMFDIDDILLAGDESVYSLIDKMFSTLSECLTTKIINNLMDEAHNIGRGRFFDLHGAADRSELLLKHLNRVSEIGRKYGFTLIMWSDMFFRLMTGGNYYDNISFSQEIKDKIPDNVQLVYWDYYSTDKKHYDKMLESHALLSDDIWFAGGLWTWQGFAPNNDFSLKTTKSALKSCEEHGIKNIFLTLWGDDGGECSRFTVLPSLFAASEYAKGNYNMGDIKRKFKEKFGISYDRFILLDLPDGPNKGRDVRNPEKYLLYNDPFAGIFDSTLNGDESERFSKCARKLSLLKKDPEWGFLFSAMHALCDALAVKANIGQETRRVYADRDTDELNALIDKYKLLIKKLNAFYKAYREQWFRENKAQGFEIQDMRIGGIIKRAENCRDRLILLRDGKIDHIDELDEKLIDAYGGGDNFYKGPVCFQSWYRTFTAGVISHGIN